MCRVKENKSQTQRPHQAKKTHFWRSLEFWINCKWMWECYHILAKSFIAFLPWALKLGLHSTQDFTVNSFSEEPCVYLILPNSCFMAFWDKREKRSKMGEMFQKLRDWEAPSQENKNKTERATDRHQERRTCLSVNMNLLECDCGQKREKSGRNKTTIINSILGNVGLHDNSRLAKQTDPFITIQNTNVSLNRADIGINGHLVIIVSRGKKFKKCLSDFFSSKILLLP